MPVLREGAALGPSGHRKHGAGGLSRFVWDEVCDGSKRLPCPLSAYLVSIRAVNHSGLGFLSESKMEREQFAW